MILEANSDDFLKQHSLVDHSNGQAASLFEVETLLLNIT
jgi:hypothetical protein